MPINLSINLSIYLSRVNPVQLHKRVPLRRCRYYGKALVYLSNRDSVDASRGRIFHCKMANNRSITVFCSLLVLA